MRFQKLRNETLSWSSAFKWCIMAVLLFKHSALIFYLSSCTWAWMAAQCFVTQLTAFSDGHRLTVMVALTRRVWQNHLHATVGGVVRPLAFFAEHVADAVGIRFVKLQRQTEERMKEETAVGRTRIGSRETLVFITSAVTERFLLWNLKLLDREGVLLRGCHTWGIWIINIVIWLLLFCRAEDLQGKLKRERQGHTVDAAL